MQFFVSHYRGYASMTINAGNADIDTGFMDVAERKALAEEMLKAINNLLCTSDMNEEEYLAWIKENT